MNIGWMRISEAARLMAVSTTTVRRRAESGDLRSRQGDAGVQEVFLPAKLRRQLELQHAQEAEHQPAEEPATLGNSDDAVTPCAESSCADDLTDAEDQVLRYERLAGGSLMLAQQRTEELQRYADAAYEQLANTRWQLRQARKVAMTGWASCAAAVAIGLTLSLAFGLSMNRSAAQAQANADAAQSATARADKLSDQLARAKAETSLTNNATARVLTR